MVKTEHMLIFQFLPSPPSPFHIQSSHFQISETTAPVLCFANFLSRFHYARYEGISLINS